MIFKETKLHGAYIVEIARLEDERGYFARAWCQREFAQHGLDPCVVQCNLSFNTYTGTLRGLHFQLPPFAEAKLVRCVQGAMYDVIVDLRLSSPSYLQWLGVELTAESCRAVYVPKGCAHGFQTLAPDTQVFYQMSEFYAPEAARGVRWNDPRFKIDWPLDVKVISGRDQSYEDYSPAGYPELL